MDWIDEMKEEKRLAEARRAAQEKIVREKKEREEERRKRLHLKHKPKFDIKVQELEEYSKRLGVAAYRSKDKLGISFSSGARGLSFHFSGEAVEVCFGIAGDRDSEVPDKSGKLSLPIDKVTVDEFTPWFQWLVGWKGKRPPVWILQKEDREAVDALKAVGLIILTLAAIISLFVVYLNYST